MHWLEIFLIGVGLSMDALAVSVALGAAEKERMDWKKVLLPALFFGGFQALMPLVGWFGGSLLGSIVQRYGCWVAAGLLWLIGGKMIWERNEENGKIAFGLKELTVLAFATSIDALLVGVGFVCLGETSILREVLLIGCTTAVISAAGCELGRTSGKLLGSHCNWIGGLVLILIGVKTVVWG